MKQITDPSARLEDRKSMTAEELRVKEREHQEDLARLRGLRPIDDTFMRCLFRDNLPLAQLVLRIITGIEDLTLISEETQKDLKRLVGARSVCLDVHGVDSKGKKYDLEVQRADEGARPERARYHASAMDIESLDAGQDFEELPETYTIFITENDLYAYGDGIYKVERTIVGKDRLFEDRQHILYVNGAYRGEDDLGELMHDFCCHEPDEMKIGLMAEGSRYWKENPKGVDYMCKAMEDMRKEAMERGMEKGLEKGLEQGIEQGMEQNRLENIRNLMTTMKLTAQQAMDALLIPADEQGKYIAML